MNTNRMTGRLGSTGVFKHLAACALAVALGVPSAPNGALAQDGPPASWEEFDARAEALAPVAPEGGLLAWVDRMLSG